MPHQNVAIIGASAVGLYAAYLLAREGILDNVGYDDFLRLLNRQARDVMEVRTRDELARALWRLVLAQPQWIMLVTRAFYVPTKNRLHRP